MSCPVAKWHQLVFVKCLTTTWHRLGMSRITCQDLKILVSTRPIQPLQCPGYTYEASNADEYSARRPLSCAYHAAASISLGRRVQLWGRHVRGHAQVPHDLRHQPTRHRGGDLALRGGGQPGIQVSGPGEGPSVKIVFRAQCLGLIISTHVRSCSLLS